MLAPEGIAWPAGARELRYPAGALLVIGGPPGAGKSTWAERVVTGAPVVDPDVVRAELTAAAGAQVDWPQALARTRERYRARLAAGEGAVLVTTALRRGHRLGLVRDAAEHGRPCHAVMLDATPAQCRAGRAAQGAPRISDGLFEHLLAEWAALRRALAAATQPPDGLASLVVLDRAAAGVVERVVLA